MDAVALDHRLRSWTDRLSRQSLPAMARTRQRVGQLLSSTTSNHRHLQRICARDPGLSLALFRALHDLPRPPKVPVTNPGHAATLLGTEQIRRSLEGLPPVNQQIKGATRESLYQCYSRAAHAAWYAAAWGQRLGLGNPDELAVAALLHELAEMLLWCHGEPEMQRIQRLIQRGASRPDAERAVMGFELNRLTLALAQQWQLPALLVAALQPVGAFQLRSLSVMLAVHLARESQQSWYSVGTLELMELVAELNRQTLDEANAGSHRLAADAAANLYGLPLPLAIHRLLQGPLPVAHEIKKHANPSKIDSNPRLTDGAKSEPESVPPVACDGIGGISQLLLQRRLVRLFRTLRGDSGVERIMFASLSTDQRRLRARFTMGAEKGTGLCQFQHTLSDRDLFALMLKKPQGVWLNPVNQQKLLPLLTPRNRITLNTDGFYLSSLFVKKRPIGILYADRNDQELLDKQSFSKFKMMAKQLCNELSHAS